MNVSIFKHFDLFIDILRKVKKLDDNSQPSDWYECFTTIIERKQKIDDENNKVQNDIRRRQDRFIQRE